MTDDSSKKIKDMLKAVRAIKGVRATAIDGNILCCVQVSLLRQDQIDSGHMRVNIPQYYTFGQMVWLMVGKTMTPEQEVSVEFWSASGASCFVVNSPEKAIEIMGNIPTIISVERECPKTTYLID